MNLVVKFLPADCGPNGPYDRIISGNNTEIKFSAAHSDNNADVPTIKRNKCGEVNWTINHVAVEKCLGTTHFLWNGFGEWCCNS